MSYKGFKSAFGHAFGNVRWPSTLSLNVQKHFKMIDVYWCCKKSRLWLMFIRIFIEKKRLKKNIYMHNSPTHTHALTDTNYTNTFRIPAQPWFS